MTKELLWIAGFTEKQQVVLGGVFTIVDTYGLPLSIVCDFLYDKEYLIAWDDFISKAIESGWNVDTIRAKIFEALVDSDNKKIKQEFIEWFDKNR